MQRGKGTSRKAAPKRGKRRVNARGQPRRLRFGNFEFDPETLELHGDSETIRLQPQPARLLHLLIASRGAVVSREAVRRHLWPDEIHVEFDQSMNSCVNRIRVALGDSAEAPRYIETLPRIGYRFLQPVMEVREGEPPLPPVRTAPTVPAPRPRSRSRRVAAAVADTSPSHPLADHAGEYEHEGYGKASVRTDGDGLVLEVAGIEFPLRHHHYDVWSVPYDLPPSAAASGRGGAKVRFDYGNDGKINVVAVPLEPSVSPIRFQRAGD